MDMLINLIVEIILQCICILNIKLYTLNSKEMGHIPQDGKKIGFTAYKKKKKKWGSLVYVTYTYRERPCEEIETRQPSTSQRERPHRKPTLYTLILDF